MTGLFAVVLAGGSGERFWPLGTTGQPKQFIPLLEGRSLYQEAMARAAAVAGRDRVLVSTRQDLLPVARAQVADLPADRFVVEPVGRNTAASIGLASLTVARQDPEALMLVLPADHHIAPLEAFRDDVAEAVAALGASHALLTFGIPPSRVETGFGHILQGDPVAPGRRVRRCLRFAEKPDRPTAQRFLADGRYLWNSGMFLWRNRAIQEALARWEPELWGALERIGAALGSARFPEVLEAEFPPVAAVPIDIGVLERAEEVWVLPARFAWDDLGAWDALERILAPDASGNVARGHHVGLRTKDCVIYAASRTVGTIGVEGLIVVETPEGVLVCPKDQAQDVKALVQAIREAGGRRPE